LEQFLVHVLMFLSHDLDLEIVASSIFPVIKVLVIENHKLDDTFLHVVFGSQSLLRTTSDLSSSDIN
jgi:hypothetical protein